MGWRATVVAVALAGAFAPIPPGAVERVYSNGVYPAVQRVVTGVSNLVPFALFDVLGIGVVVWWIVTTARDMLARRARGWGRTALLIARRTIVATALIYVGFLVSWGLNYRRVPLVARLEFETADITLDGIRELALTAVDEVNSSYESAHGDVHVDGTAVDPLLADAFDRAQQSLRVWYPARPARPKRTLLDVYFKAASVEGMTAPFVMETLVPSDLLPVERPFVVAHEWSHLAGFADEGEASFVAWLTCVRGSPGSRYSGWLALFGEAAGALPEGDRTSIAERLGPGPRKDLYAIAERRRRNVNPTVSLAGWRAYDRYLKANRVEAGAASYGEVLRLVLGARFGTAWTPILKPS
jgi:hypothetical protein